MLKFYKILLLSIVLCSLAFAQSMYDYRSATSGNWSSASTWQVYNGSNWVSATVPPDTTYGAIEIQAGHVVNVDKDVVVDSVIVNGTLIVNSGVILRVDSTWNTPAGIRGIVVNPGGAMTVYGTYHHNRNRGIIPTATWETGSTCLITGVSNIMPANGAQNFYNLIYNCPSQSGNLNLGWNRGTINIGGDMVVLCTGTGRFQPCAPTVDSSVTVNVNGNILLDGSSTTNSTLRAIFAAHGTSNSNTHVTINVYGNINVVGNPNGVTWTNFGLTRGSQSGSGTTTWNLYGDFRLSNASLQNSNTLAGGAVLKFCKQGIQKFYLINENYAGGPINVIVNSGVVLDMDTTTLEGSGTFVLSDGAELQTAHPAGINGSIQCTADHSAAIPGGNFFSTSASYDFKGTSAQITGTLLPDTVYDLTIDNSSGVFLSKPVTINHYLYLSNGVLDNCTNNVTVPSDRIIYGNGSLACPANKVEILEFQVPRKFNLSNNYPNPFNPYTELSFTVAIDGYTTLKVYNILGQCVSTLFEGKAKTGEEYRVRFDASNLPTGLYFARLQQNSNLIIRQMVLLK